MLMRLVYTATFLPLQDVPLEIVEKEFWRIASSFHCPMHVEYGADLHTNDYGSGFPTKPSAELTEKDKVNIYFESVEFYRVIICEFPRCTLTLLGI